MPELERDVNTKKTAERLTSARFTPKRDCPGYIDGAASFLLTDISDIIQRAITYEAVYLASSEGRDTATMQDVERAYHQLFPQQP
jgi:hypothetical protein